VKVHGGTSAGREYLTREPGIEEFEELRDRVGGHFGLAVSRFEALCQLDVDAVDERLMSQAA